MSNLLGPKSIGSLAIELTSKSYITLVGYRQNDRNDVVLTFSDRFGNKRECDNKYFTFGSNPSLLIDTNSIIYRTLDKVKPPSVKEPKLERDNKHFIDVIEKQQQEIANYKIITHREFSNEDCWIWMNDYPNYPSSLVCPVVISMKELTRIAIHGFNGTEESDND